MNCGGNMLKQFYMEVKKVGLKDWFWFVVLHNRNEFHHKFGLLNYPLTEEGALKCTRDRNRAHRLDEILN